MCIRDRLRGEIDLAVHSLKDLPTRLPPGLAVAAVPERGDPRDALVSQTDQSLFALPSGARVGTSSRRRAAQLLALRPDLRVEPIRGNVDTRLRKVEEGRYDAVILAVAGLARLGWADRITEIFAPEIMLPAVGQGALAVEVRADDERIRSLVAPLDHPATRAATTAEALETIEASGPWAAAVVDLDLIGSHARGRLAELRQAHPSLPIIALDSLSECRGQGEGVEPFDAVVAKPFVLSPLLTLLGQLASRRQQTPSL